MKFNDPNIAVIGLGYVGFPLAVAFSQKYNVIGFDINIDRVNELKNGIDKTNEVKQKVLGNIKNITFTSDESLLKDKNIYIITVPTPVDKSNNPDLRPLISATKTVSRYLNKNDIVVYESTVYPGCTEQVCVPILENHSGLIYNSEFFCGYSPERINPGDQEHTLINICKITSGSTPEIADYIDALYKSIIKGGTYKVSSMVIAEAAKVIENTQRDVNIALVNELALIFDKLKISTNEVLEAASTKWNFFPFKPGLVGGHCIGVDPYYLTHKAMEVGHHPQIILAGRKINDNMGDFIAEKTISELAKQDISPLGAKVAILGLSFKENCPDFRNSKVITIIKRLRHYNCKISISDPHVNPEDVEVKHNIRLENLKSIKKQDAVIIAVAHNQYKKIGMNDWGKILRRDGVIIDVKSVFKKNYFSEKRFKYWSL